MQAIGAILKILRRGPWSRKTVRTRWMIKTATRTFCHIYAGSITQDEIEIVAFGLVERHSVQVLTHDCIIVQADIEPLQNGLIHAVWLATEDPWEVVYHEPVIPPLPMGEGDKATIYLRIMPKGIPIRVQQEKGGIAE